MKRRKGFTLVELLVVIGIIALLISILLPALSKARQTAYKASCLSNLHNMAVALTLYANQNHGTLPPARGLWQPDGEYTWGSQLSYMMGMGTGSANTGLLNGNQLTSRKVFICKDAPDFAGAVIANTYSVHPLLMPNLGFTSYAQEFATPGADPASGALTYPAVAAAWGPYAGKNRRPYKISQIRTPQDIVCIWDGVVNTSSAAAAGGVTQGSSSADGYALDQQRIVNASPTVGPVTYLLSDYAASQGVDQGQSVDGGINTDSATLSNTDRILGNIRWRHMNNKMANFLYVDGHAASLPYNSEFKTGLLRRNVDVPRLH